MSDCSGNRRKVRKRKCSLQSLNVGESLYMLDSILGQTVSQTASTDFNCVRSTSTDYIAPTSSTGLTTKNSRILPNKSITNSGYERNLDEVKSILMESFMIRKASQKYSSDSNNIKNILGKNTTPRTGKDTAVMKNAITAMVKYPIRKTTSSLWLMTPKNKMLQDIDSVESFRTPTLTSITPGKLVQFDPNSQKNPTQTLTQATKTVLPEKEWTNPVLGVGIQEILPSLVNSKRVLSRTNFDKIYSSVSFTKSGLSSIHVIGQVERQFIACTLKDSTQSTVLALIDQHAAHERIRLEKLLKKIGYYDYSKLSFNTSIDLKQNIGSGCNSLENSIFTSGDTFGEATLIDSCSTNILVERPFEHFIPDSQILPNNHTLSTSKISNHPTCMSYNSSVSGASNSNNNSLKHNACRLFPPAEVLFYENEIDQLLHYTEEFNQIGLRFSVQVRKQKSSSHRKVYISSVPSVFVNVCQRQSEAKGSNINESLIKEFILEQARLLRSGLGKCNMSSPAIFKVLASYACHGAIKFGDELSTEDCINLVKQLSNCQLPFQCAHGRPSIIPLVTLKMILPAYKKRENRRSPNLKRLLLDRT